MIQHHTMRSPPPLSLLLPLLLSLPSTLAEPLLTLPEAGASLPAGPITITWTDGGHAPSISDLNTYQLLLFTGSNNSPYKLADLKTGSFSDGDTVSATISPGSGGSGLGNS